MPFQGFGGLLQQIANPKVADVPGAMLAADRSRADTNSVKANTAATTAATSMSAEKLKAAKLKTQSDTLQSMYFDAAAMLPMEPAARVKMFDVMKKKYSANPALVQTIDDISKMNRESQDAEIIQMLDVGKTMKFFQQDRAAGKEPDRYIEMDGKLFDTETKDFAKDSTGKDLDTKRYKGVGPNVWDRQTNKWIAGPKFLAVKPDTEIIRVGDTEGDYKSIFKSDLSRTDLQKHLDDRFGKNSTGSPERNKVVQAWLENESTGGKTTLEKDAVAAGLTPGTQPFYDFVTNKYHPTIGTIPTGFKYTNGSLVPIPGSKPDLERRKAKLMLDESMIYAREKTRRIQAQVAAAYGLVDTWTTGNPGKALRFMLKSGEAQDLLQLLETLKAQLGFDQLQKMRDLSPTGGALGQVSERELAQLERAVQSLSTDQSPSQLKRNLLLISNTRVGPDGEGVLVKDQNGNDMPNTKKGFYEQMFDATVRIAHEQSRALGVSIGETEDLKRRTIEKMNALERQRNPGAVKFREDRAAQDAIDRARGIQ